jgi:hypothetical protein
MLRSTANIQRAAAGLACAALVAACGSGAHHTTTTTASGVTRLNGHLMTFAQANRDMLRFASCLRSHGVEGLPNPVAAPAAFKHSFTSTSPTFTSAMTACGHLLPGQENGARQSSASTHQQVQAMLAFARCIRGRGFTRFPDPTSTGSVTHQMLAQAGIDLHQPAVVQAADACVHVTHGLLTRADVAHFIAGQ